MCLIFLALVFVLIFGAGLSELDFVLDFSVGGALKAPSLNQHLFFLVWLGWFV